MSTDLETVEVDHSPVRLSSGIAAAAALVSALTSAPYTLLALPLGFGGFLLVTGGLFVSENRTWVSLGSAGLFFSAVVSGAYGTPVELVLISVAGAILAWDVGQNAISIGNQLGGHSQSRRIQLVHASVSTLVASIVAGVGYAIYRFAAGGQPTASLILLLLGIVIIIWAIRS